MTSLSSFDRHILGQGRFTSDLSLPGMLHACFLRSPHAHAGIRSIDVSAAAGMPGVRLVLTGRDAEIAACRPMPTVPVTGIGGRAIAGPEWRILATDRVRHAGQTVALVVAESEDMAREAAEAISVVYDPLPAIGGLAEAQSSEAPLLCPDAPGNVALDWETGDESVVAQAMARAARVVRLSLSSQRLAPAFLEPRSGLAQVGEDGRLVLHTPSQGAAMLRQSLAAILGLPAEQLRVVTPDVGGAFGAKTAPYPEQAVLLVAARRLGQPVKWVASRSESFLSDSQGRGSAMDGALALDADGRFLALEVRATQMLGAYLTPHGAFTATGNFAACLSGCYAIPAIHVRVRCMLANTAPLAPYRGAGRPEANYLLECLVDRAAKEAGQDAVALRRSNLVPPSALPYRTPLGQTYDSGDFPTLLEKAEAQADRAGFAARRQASAARGLLRGFGLGLYLETSGGLPFESAGLRFLPGGRVELLAGGQSSGQGHDITLVRALAGRLGIDPGRIDFLQGDSDRLPGAGPSVASRTMAASGTAIDAAAQEMLDKGLPVAAELLQADPARIVFAEGAYRIPETGQAASLWAVAERAAGLLDVTTKVTAAPTYPNGCHFAEVEIDPRTGSVALVRYGALDDVGTPIDHDILAGQLQGGLAQGLGQALMEHTIYDSVTGQLLTGSFMDYPLPRATDVPAAEAAEFTSSPCATNPLGVKGAGEGGTTGSLAPIMMAINDALAQAGAGPVEMPANPARVWAALRRGRH